MSDRLEAALEFLEQAVDETGDEEVLANIRDAQQLLQAELDDRAD